MQIAGIKWMNFSKWFEAIARHCRRISRLGFDAQIGPEDNAALS
jgi:hypothetical protein